IVSFARGADDAGTAGACACVRNIPAASTPTKITAHRICVRTPNKNRFTKRSVLSRQCKKSRQGRTPATLAPMKRPLEAEARLQFNYSACQAGRCLAKCRVIAIDSPRAGGRNGDVCYPLITQRSKIHLVKQVIEICPQLEAGIFTEDSGIRNSKV